MKTIIIDGMEFKQKEVVLPVSKFKGSKTNYLGFDATIFKNRYKDYDPDITTKTKIIHNILLNKFGKDFELLSKESFYIKSLDLCIDLRLDYKHNFNAYSPTYNFHIHCLNELIENNETEIIKQWCILDPQKRLQMISSGKKYLEIFHFNNEEDLLEQIKRVFIIKREYSEEELGKELKNIVKNVGQYNSTPAFNKIVTHFNPHIFANENLLYSNPVERRRHIENCRFLQYKEEHELSTEDILINFRFNKFVTYYSYFSIGWAKRFYEEYKPVKVLDPFGGWGHRYLAFLNIEYIYNDYWKETYNGVLQIHNFCKSRIQLPNKKFYCEDITKFKINEIETYDCVFTCPPYFNYEIYNGVKYNDYANFLDMWEASVKNCVHDKLKIFSFIIKNIYGDDLVNVCKKYNLVLEKEIALGRNTNHHYNKNKNVKKIEHLYILTRRTSNEEKQS